MPDLSREAKIKDLEESLEAYRMANARGGNWETHQAECVVERQLNELRSQP